MFDISWQVKKFILKNETEIVFVFKPDSVCQRKS